MLKPFIKWVGGKTQLLNDINDNLPVLSGIDTYIEPFVGGGAVLFDIVPRLPFIKYVVINDLNYKLTNVYKVIKYKHEELIKLLKKYEHDYWYTDIGEKEIMFYDIRDEFNSIDSLDSLDVKLAAQFIFLNKTCFNGLYRENSKGKFNSPWNKSVTPCICDEETISDVAAFLIQYDVTILTGSYSNIKEYTEGRKCLIYFDPPYRPITKSSAFTSYTKSGFNDDKQIELKLFCDGLSKDGHMFMLSNSDPKNNDPDDNFFDDLYKEYEIKRVYAKRNINSKGNKRHAITEILVKNY